MKLRRVWIGNFYNLQDLSFELEHGRSIYGGGRVNLRFLVGTNGSGKSNLLLALGMIFGHLAEETSPGFAFEVEYELRDSIVCVTTRPPPELQAPSLPRIEAALLVRHLEEPGWKPEHVRRTWGSSGVVLPQRVVGYSSGPTSGFEWGLRDSIERLVRARLGEAQTQERPSEFSEDQWRLYIEEQRQRLEEECERFLDSPNTLFVEARDAMLAALALLAHQGGLPTSLAGRYQELRAEILKTVGLEEQEPLLAFTLYVKSDWQDRLGRARREPLQALLNRATVLLRQPEGDTPESRDLQAVFDLDEPFRRATLGSLFPSPLAFFEALHAWRRRGAVSQVRLVLRAHGVRSLLPETALSDGEFLYLGRSALMMMIREIPDSLVLLDEPDTHYNDHWKVRLVDNLVRILDVSNEGRTDSAEVLLASHSDLVLTDADSRQVYILRQHREEDSNGLPTRRISIVRPVGSPFGANRSEIGRELFGIGTIGTHAERDIEETLKTGTQQEVRDMLHRVGPGFYRFQLMDRLVQMEDEDAPSD